MSSRKSKLKVKRCFSLLLVSLLPLFLYSQITFEKVFGHSFDEYGHSVIQTIDSGYIICGFSSSFPYKNEDVYIIKTNELGDIIWSKNYGSNADEHGYSISETSDSGYIISAEYYNSTENILRAYLLRINFEGDTLWTQKYPGLGTANARCTIETFEGGYILCGSTHSSESRDVYLVKTDESGEILWSKTIGGPNDEWSYDMKQTSDSGYIICGGTEIDPGYDDFYVIKTDTLGDTIWTRHFGGVGYDAAYSVVQNTDGSYFVGGTSWNVGGSTSFDILIVKLNNQGDTIWTKRYGGYNQESGCSLSHSGDDEIIVCGSTKSFGAGNFDMYLFKIDTAGTMLWSKTFGGVEPEIGYSVHQTYDEGYILCGYTMSFGSGNADIYLIKTNSEGLLTAIDDFIINDSSAVLIYPNPNQGHFTINLPQYEVKIQLINKQGQIVFEKDFNSDMPHNNTQIELSGLSRGLYFMRLCSNSGTVQSQKLIIF